MESPEYIRLSTAASILLGFERGLFYRGAIPLCINFLLCFNDGCKANCLYCGQAREVSKDSMCKTLIRVEWPCYKLSDVLSRIKERILGNGCFLRPNRICVATITNYKAKEAEIEVIKNVKKELNIPISALITPTLFREEDMKELRNAGAERIGIAIDCATKEIFDILRGSRARGPHRWERYLNGVEEAVNVMGKGKVGIHLIIGLGETERDAVNLMQWARDIGAETHLFSFYPEEGSVLEEWIRPPISQYRRVQLARYLIDNGIARAEDMKFNEHGQIIDFGVPERELELIIDLGEPFLTSGCPGCNRPYANERPSEPIRNYPFPPSRRDIAMIKRQLRRYITPKNDLKSLLKYLGGLRSEVALSIPQSAC